MKVHLKHGKVTQNMHGASTNYRYVWDISLLHEEFRNLNLEIVPHGFLSTLVAKPTLEDQIIVAQRRARGVRRIKENIASGVVKCFSTYSKGTVFFKNHLVVPKNRNIRQLI